MEARLDSKHHACQCIGGGISQNIQNRRLTVDR